MGKLHELLAVEPELKGQAQRAMSQVKSLFTGGTGRLIGQTRSYQPLDEGGERFEDEITIMAATVEAELDKVATAYGAWMNAAIQKERTNQVARADIVLDDVTFIGGLPATALLNLESKLAELKQVYAAIPTNDPTIKWEYDDQLGYFVSRPRITYRTQKVPRTHVLYEATPEHPAQVELFHEDVRVGTWTTIIHSGGLTPREKQVRLQRVGDLLRAVKQARQRANTVDIEPFEVAKRIFNYINGG